MKIEENTNKQIAQETEEQKKAKMELRLAIMRFLDHYVNTNEASKRGVVQDVMDLLHNKIANIKKFSF